MVIWVSALYSEGKIPNGDLFFDWHYDVNKVSIVYYSRNVIYPTWFEIGH